MSEIRLTVEEQAIIRSLMAWYINVKASGTLINDPSRIDVENALRVKFGIDPMSTEQSAAIRSKESRTWERTGGWAKAQEKLAMEELDGPHGT